MRWIAKAGIQAALARMWGGEALNHMFQRWNKTIGSPQALARRIQFGISFWERISDAVNAEGRHVLEVGTGWDGIHTILLWALGADKITTVDHIPHLRLQPAVEAAEAWRSNVDHLSRFSGQPASRIASRLSSVIRCKDLGDLLSSMNVTYVAPGDVCRTAIPDRSVDLVYGYAVLAHFPRPVLEAFCRECSRILVPGGLSVQRIGLEDPFNDWNGGDFVNFLRFSPTVWKLLGEHSITYHNRLRAAEFREIFESHGGITIRSRETIPPESLARVKSMRLAPQFRNFTPEQLAVTELDLISRFG